MWRPPPPVRASSPGRRRQSESGGAAMGLAAGARALGARLLRAAGAPAGARGGPAPAPARGGGGGAPAPPALAGGAGARGMASGSVGRRGLSPKRSAKGFYKGKGARATGRRTKHGRYQILERKLPVYVAPVEGAGDVGLRPYVAPNTPKQP